MKLKDKQIIRGLKEGNRHTVQYVYDNYFHMCQYIVTTNGGNKEDSKDIFQEALLILIQKIAEPEFKLSSQFQTFLFSVLNNQWKVELAKRKRTKKISEVPFLKDHTDEELVNYYDQKISSSLLWKCFNKLRKDCQDILRLWWNGHGQKEIAGVLSYKYGYLRKKKINCDESLICIIKENEELMDIIKDDPDLISRINFT
ncbi:MAG: sigma-70 family RNA polymerase sigma factor [Bacteroidales bacterium]|nr:sigma-70 family RNA polymerase sigma factor [Bacteroidales bacterium]